MEVEEVKDACETRVDYWSWGAEPELHFIGIGEITVLFQNARVSLALFSGVTHGCQ